MLDRLTEVSLSTMWSKDRYSHMEEFVREVGEFGFTQVELNSILTPERLRQLLEVGGIKISSVHCPCPATLSSKGVWNSELSLSALDKEARGEAIELGKSTIELASRVGAKAVILHVGQVGGEFSLERRLRYLYNQGLTSSREFDSTREQLIEERDSKAGAYLEAAKESISDLLGFAVERGILLGLENRIHYYEIPSLEEMEQLLSDFAGKPIGYWHDVGHAEVLSRLGFHSHHEWFSHLGGELIGVHLHDVRGIRDHCAPGIGSVDWDFIAANLPRDALRVCEIGEWNKAQDVCRVVRFLEKKSILQF